MKDRLAMSYTKKLLVAIVFSLSLFSVGMIERLTAEPFRSGTVMSSMQNDQLSAMTPYNPLVQDSYFTDEHGNILMVVKVLGQVNKPGQIVVRENSDFSTIFALAGGVNNNANLKKVIVARKEPDSNGNQAYMVNLNEYYKKGDRYGFIALKPNDTIIVPEKKGLNFDLFSRIALLTLAGLAAF
jgi:hypothetical protein